MAASRILIAVGTLLLSLAGLVLGARHLANGNDPLSESGPEPLLRKLNVENIDSRDAAPEFLLKDLNGKRFTLRDYRGRVVLLSFWATWCPACRQEMPSLEALRRKLASEGFMIVGVSLRERSKDVEAFLREHQLSFPILLDTHGKVSDRYEVWSIPTTFIIDKNGRVLGKMVGNRDWESEESIGILRALVRHRN